MEQRKWEELNKDCLVQIFERVGLESLLLNIPFVCKTWHKASFDPLCWKTLDFGVLDMIFRGSFNYKFECQYSIKKFSTTKFIMFVIRRSCGSAINVALPCNWTFEILEHIANECPSLKRLYVTSTVWEEKARFLAKLVGKFKYLEFLHLEHKNFPIKEILCQISLHCKNFISFSSSGTITDEDASAIALIPKIKYLFMKECRIRCEELLVILQGCRELEFIELDLPFGICMDHESCRFTTSHTKY
ncbi:hypothetical protein AQUCO_01500484v1 [Aquilegia coerulea]|uniref:F-box domain-containing protein n=1 Tax=Aquilegia coerulea TaxID=218851 RepID=A0A2G5DU55_AQUCA|nr:hypothetical protein AQUCO_01500484v1 [Aquilegia coerulea]